MNNATLPFESPAPERGPYAPHPGMPPMGVYAAESAQHDPHGLQAEPPVLSKRDQNRQAMRQAIIEAAQALVVEKGYGNFTANDVAREAGCSRRTFFNYFPTLPAAIMEPSYSLNDAVAHHILTQPADTPFYELVLGLLRIFDGNEAQLQTIIQMAAMCEKYPEIQRYDLQGWLRFTEVLEESLGARLPEADPLALKCLVHAISSAARIACEETSRVYAQNPEANLSLVLRDTTHRLLLMSFEGIAQHLPALSQGQALAAPLSPTPHPEG